LSPGFLVFADEAADLGPHLLLLLEKLPEFFGHLFIPPK
jgi:hypothetical protein